jgi:hypothetical protein
MYAVYLQPLEPLHRTMASKKSSRSFESAESYRETEAAKQTSDDTHLAPQAETLWQIVQGTAHIC